MKNLEPLDSILFFCECGITAKGTPHQCTAEPIAPESFWDWTPADVKWAIFAVTALIVFVAIGVTQ
jgi:hypothetical protein